MSVRDPDLIRQEIEQTRHELGEAVEELAAKTDVKARAQEKLKETRSSAAQLPTKARERPAVALAVVAGATLVAVVLLRRR